MKRIPNARLIRVATASRNVLSMWAEGVDLATVADRPLVAVRLQVAAARFALAVSMRQAASRIAASTLKAHRTVVSRSYYSMYHALRAAAFVHHGGDDHQEHKELHKFVPKDLPEYERWSNQLKSARDYRNQADYEPYPVSTAYWEKVAEIVQRDAQHLLPVTRAYLKDKGCNV